MSRAMDILCVPDTCTFHCDQHDLKLGSDDDGNDIENDDRVLAELCCIDCDVIEFPKRLG